MSDYSFMKTGFDNPVSDTLLEIDLKNIEILLSLFIGNAIKNASKYIKICKRSGITKDDIVHGLRYEVFEFINRKSLHDDIQQSMDDYSNWDSDEEEEPFFEDECIVDDCDIEPFSRVLEHDILEKDDEFVKKFHNYYDTWSQWIPDTPMNKILKNAIDKSNL
jgi:histone H3/H4